jgi:hypothetical protein
MFVFAMHLKNGDTRVARFFAVKHTKTEKIYQLATKYMYQMSSKKTNGLKVHQYFPQQDPPEFPQIGNIGINGNSGWH